MSEEDFLNIESQVDVMIINESTTLNILQHLRMSALFIKKVEDIIYQLKSIILIYVF